MDRTAFADQAKIPLISIVIPMLNEREGLPLFFSTLHSAIGGLPIQWEIIAVDDGSTDGTRDILPTQLSKFPFWRALTLSRNFGQQAAYRAGLGAATGDAVVFLDADLQDPPDLIPALVDAWQHGFKVVTACRTGRAETGLRRWLFDSFHHIFQRITRGNLPRNSGMYSLIDRVIVDRLLDLKEVNLFLPALKCWFGFSQTTVDYVRSKRAVGEPKQSIGKLFGYALDAIFSFSELPLQWIGILGLAVSIASFGYGCILVLIKFAQVSGYLVSLEVKGFTTLAAAIFCLGGIQLLCLGIIGQYLARMYRELRERPLFVIQEIFSSDESARVRESR
jgi:polyisoprenyl-phosphate glycosyltransferase